MKNLKKKSIISLILVMTLVFNIVALGAIQTIVYAEETYTATLSDLDYGTAQEDYNSDDYSKEIKVTNTGSTALSGSTSNMKIELTGGDTEAFFITFEDSGIMENGGTFNKAITGPKAGLPAGTYSATATLSYDRDGDETEFDWEVLDTANLTFTVTNSNTTQYTVSFMDESSVLSTITVNDGAKVARPETDPTKSENTFDDWYTDLTYATKYDFENTTISSDISIFAKFNPNTCTITLDQNGGEGSTGFIPVTYGSDWIMENASAYGITAPSGKEFDGWKINDTVYQAGQTYTNITSDITAIAQWKNVEVTQFTVTFNSNGGSEVASQKVNSGENAIKPENPTYEKHLFMEWYTDSTYTTIFNFNTPITANITLYAKWVESVTITLDINGGVAGDAWTNTIEMPKGMVTAMHYIEEPPVEFASAQEGYYFAGLEINGVKYFVDFELEEPIIINEDTTIKLLWNEYIKEVNITLVPPTVGIFTEMEKDEDGYWSWDSPTNAPYATVSASEGYEMDEYSY